MRRQLLTILPASCAALAASCAVASGDAGFIPADAVDFLGETIGGIGSAIEVFDEGKLVMLSDRGPGDGTVDYRPRLQVYLTSHGGSSLTTTLDRTILLKDGNGKAYSGLFPEAGMKELPKLADGRECIDPEGLAVAPDGRFFVSEEYGPGIFEFSAEGKFLRRFETPAECVPRGEDGVNFAAEEVEELESGREPNRGFEGLTLMPGGKTLAVILQSGLIQDGGRASTAVRLYLYNIASGKAISSYAVPFSDLTALNSGTPAGKSIQQKHLVYSSLSALPDGRLLALERENFGADGTKKPDAARYKGVVLLDPTAADNILGKPLTADVLRVKQVQLLNLAELDEKALGVPREGLGAKWEGIALLGVKDGRAQLMLASDNDFLNPTLMVDRGGVREIAFPKSARAQATHLIELSISIPPADAVSEIPPSENISDS